MRVPTVRPKLEAAFDAAALAHDAAPAATAHPFSSLQAQKFNFMGSLRRNKRCGAAVVEFAVVAPLLFLFILGMIEFGRATWVQEQMTNAAREGARRGLLPNSTSAEVQQVVVDYLGRAGVSGVTTSQVTATVPEAQGQWVVVTVTIPFNNVSLLSVPKWLGSKSLQVTVQMQKEVNDS